MTRDTQEEIIEELMRLGLDVQELAKATGLYVGRVQAFCHLESPSDTVAAAKLLAIAVQARAVAWGG